MPDNSARSGPPDSSTLPRVDAPPSRVVVVRCGTVQRRLRPGEGMSFGRRPAPVDPAVGPPEPHLGLSDCPALHARAGHLSVDDTGCTIANTGR